MRRFLLPLLFLIIFIGESVFVEYTSPDLFGENRIVVPRFLIVALIFLTVYVSKRYGVLYGFIFGLLFDIVYTEIIGVYLFLFPAVAYIVHKLMKILQQNIVIVTLAALIGTAILELGAYEINFLIHQTSMEFSIYLSRRLIPTLLLNLIFVILAAYPLKKYFERLVDSIEPENFR